MKPTPLLLLMPFLWPSSVLAQPAPQQPTSPHTWRPSQKTDAAATYTYTRFTLVGRFVSPPHDQASNMPALAVDCIPGGKGSHARRGKLLGASLIVGTALKIIYVEPEEIRGMSYDPKIAIRYRTGDAQADKEAQWSAGTDKTSASIPKDSLKDLLRAHSVAITADDDHGSGVAMQFDMPDPSIVEQACNVDEP
jgi:hypothetical protein